MCFNLGDGYDTVSPNGGADKTLSLGGGARYVDLLFAKNDDDLVLQIGISDQISFADYYADASNRSFKNLQLIIENSSDYDAQSEDVTRNKKVETFDFAELVAAFDSARASSPELSSWALTNALVTNHLSASDTAAIGGDLSYQYARGSMWNVSFTPALSILGASDFGTSSQALQDLSLLQDSSRRLSA